VEKQKPAIIAQTKDNAAFQAAFFEGFSVDSTGSASDSTQGKMAESRFVLSAAR
jgi:hypothetical protein